MNDRPYKILFVCSGNTCRSPMAEALLRDLLPESLGEQIEIASAGVHAQAGGAASPQAVEVARVKGLDLNHHRSRPLTASLVRDADLILAMEPTHIAGVVKLVPESRDRVHLLSELGSEPGRAAEAIHDPFGGSLEIYEECLLRVERHLRRIIPHLEERLTAERRSQDRE